MSAPSPGGGQPGPAALFTDLYELRMAQAYVADGVTDTAEFELFFRKLPPARGYVIAAGLEPLVNDLLALRFDDAELEYLATLGEYSADFLDWLAGFRFRGDIDALPEGTAVFPNVPLVRVRAPLPDAQLLETRVINTLHLPSLIAAKAARIVDAAHGHSVVDFGARRAHGIDAAVAAARAAWIAGCDGTSNMIAGQYYGIPVVGTMAHSYIQAYRDETQAFRNFIRHYPETTLLIDTYDTLAGADKVIALRDELGDEFRVQAVRLDSGDLGELARGVRERLDRAGMENVRIIASGGLDEYGIDRLIADGAPIDGFGVGTDLVTSSDAPTLDFAYKLVSYAGRHCLKGSTAKKTLPGAKQVYRRDRDGILEGDTIAGENEVLNGKPLLEPIVRGGERVRPEESLESIRERATAQRDALPPHLRSLDPVTQPYPVAVSDTLQAEAERLLAEQASG